MQNFTCGMQQNSCRNSKIHQYLQSIRIHFKHTSAMVPRDESNHSIPGSKFFMVGLCSVRHHYLSSNILPNQSTTVTPSNITCICPHASSDFTGFHAIAIADRPRHRIGFYVVNDRVDVFGVGKISPRPNDITFHELPLPIPRPNDVTFHESPRTIYSPVVFDGRMRQFPRVGCYTCIDFSCPSTTNRTHHSDERIAQDHRGQTVLCE